MCANTREGEQTARHGRLSGEALRQEPADERRFFDASDEGMTHSVAAVVCVAASPGPSITRFMRAQLARSAHGSDARCGASPYSVGLLSKGPSGGLVSGQMGLYNKGAGAQHAATG